MFTAMLLVAIMAGFFGIVEGNKDGSSILWDVRFPTKGETLEAIETYKRRLQCRFGWGV
jgi:hypothetical protein